MVAAVYEDSSRHECASRRQIWPALAGPSSVAVSAGPAPATLAQLEMNMVRNTALNPD